MERLEKTARENVERYLADCIAEVATVAEIDSDVIYDEALSLAFNGALDAGADFATAHEIAERVAESYAGGREQWHQSI